jgi:hypothetical protein
MKRFYFALLLIPVAVLLSWWAGVQIYLRLLPTPLWVMQSNGVISSLEMDMNNSGSSGAALAVPVSEHSIPSRRAALIAWQSMRRQTGQNVTISDGPSLVIISYPDGLQRLTWRSIALLGLPAGGTQGMAIAAYVDAATGEPLAVVENIVIVDPALSALTKPADAAYWVIFMTNGPLFLLGGYLILLALLLLLLSALRSWRRMRD